MAADLSAPDSTPPGTTVGVPEKPSLDGLEAPEGLSGQVLIVGFGRFGLRRLVGYAAPGNAASCRVLEKAGLAFEREVAVFGLTARRHAVERG
jgi:hypothetical protein